MIDHQTTELPAWFKAVCSRWSLSDSDIEKLAANDPHRMGFAIGISVVLGDLFNDDRAAELQWMSKPRPQFGGVSALEHMLNGDVRAIMDVMDITDEARGLR